MDYKNRNYFVGKKYNIDVTAQAYYENEAITAEQENTYAIFLEIQTNKMTGRIEKLLKDFYEDIDFEKFYLYQDKIKKGAPGEFLTPKYLLIQRDGECALLFDDENDLDNGMVVILYPKEEVMTQDNYL